VFGKPSERQLAEHNGMWDILFKVMDRMKPGVPVSEIFAYSQSLLAKTAWRNYSDHPAKRIGHGIGLETEPPSLSASDERVLAAGMIITPEPKIETVEGLLNPEEHIVITQAGYEIFSNEPKWELNVVQ
jgi:Xaa-Pro aminopeptidase